MNSVSGTGLDELDSLMGQLSVDTSTSSAAGALNRFMTEELKHFFVGVAACTAPLDSLATDLAALRATLQGGAGTSCGHCGPPSDSRIQELAGIAKANCQQLATDTEARAAVLGGDRARVEVRIRDNIVSALLRRLCRFEEEYIALKQQQDLVQDRAGHPPAAEMQPRYFLRSANR